MRTINAVTNKLKAADNDAKRENDGSYLRDKLRKKIGPAISRLSGAQTDKKRDRE